MAAEGGEDDDEDDDDDDDELAGLTTAASAGRMEAGPGEWIRGGSGGGVAIGSPPSSSLSELEAVGTPADCSASAWSATMMIRSDVNGGGEGKRPNCHSDHQIGNELQKEKRRRRKDTSVIWENQALESDNTLHSSSLRRR